MTIQYVPACRKLLSSRHRLKDEDLLDHGKNGFAERSQILAGYRKAVLSNHQNNN